MKNEISKIESWINEYVTNSGASGVVIGISGGKDSLICAKLCADAIGKENVLGVILPNGKMQDFEYAKKCCTLLDIPNVTLNIKSSYDAVLKNTKITAKKFNKNISDITKINTPPRLRMTTLYAIAGSLNFLVVNTSNLSETMVGYCTKWGDNVGDFAPIANYTKTEVCELGLALGLPEELVNKTPSDGLSGKSDEEKLGFSYESLDKFIRTGERNESYNIIEMKNKSAYHKLRGVAKFENDFKNYLSKKPQK